MRAVLAVMSNHRSSQLRVMKQHHSTRRKQNKYYVLVREFVWPQVAQGHSALVLFAGRLVAHRLHPLQLRVLPFVQLGVLHFAYLHADTPVDGGTACAQEDADVVRGPLDIVARPAVGTLLVLVVLELQLRD